MSTTLVPLEEYLDTDYSPDREYVDGVIVERFVGKRHHSRVQSNFNYFLSQRYPALFVWPELRVRTSPSRVRIPDICVTVEDPQVDVFEAPPLICVEILSPDDRTGDTLEKLGEYAAMGVPHIWVVDPRRRKAFTYSNGCLDELTGSELTAGPEISLPLSEVFARL
jgi:Uma2 family endonuclease